MTEIQAKLLELLCEIDEICRKHDIKYSLFAGTALGAERHKGFIPWDDDADIIMTLKNYKKFLRAFDVEKKDNRALNCLERNSEYPFTYARYVNTGTTALQKHTTFGGCDPGIKVDIFIVVPTYRKMEKAEQHRMEILAFSELICSHKITFLYRPEGFVEAFTSEQSRYEQLGRKAYIKERLNNLKYRKRLFSGKYVLFTGMACNSYVLDSRILDDVVYTPFENTELPVSKFNIDFLKKHYGERWISIPSDIMNSVHFSVLDLHKSYHGYLDTLWEEMDCGETEKSVAERKSRILEERFKFDDVLTNTQHLKNLVVELGVSREFEMLPDYQSNNWKMLSHIFSRYFTAQLQKANEKTYIFISLDKEVFHAAMLTAIMTDRYAEAADIIEIGLQSGKLNSDDDAVKCLMHKIRHCAELTESLYVHKDLKKVKSLLSHEQNTDSSRSLTSIIAALWVEVDASDSPDGLQRICEEVDAHAELYGDLGELLIIKGYCLEVMGNHKEAAEVYHKAAQNVRNGFVYQYLIEKGFDAHAQSREIQ